MSDEQAPISITRQGTHAGSAPPEPAPAGAAADPGPLPERPARPCQTPLIDIHEGPEGLILEADLPGAHEATLVVQVEDNVLSLRARSDLEDDPRVRLIHQEFQPGEFARSFILSDEVERDRISAEIKNGVLRLELPRSERARTRRIEVKSP